MICQVESSGRWFSTTTRRKVVGHLPKKNRGCWLSTITRIKIVDYLAGVEFVDCHVTNICLLISLVRLPSSLSSSCLRKYILKVQILSQMISVDSNRPSENIFRHHSSQISRPHQQPSFLSNGNTLCMQYINLHRQLCCKRVNMYCPEGRLPLYRVVRRQP